MTIKRYKIHTDTAFCGEWNDYVAWCDDEHFGQMEDVVSLQAYDNYNDFRDFDEEQSDDEWSYTIDEWEDPDEEWEWYEVIYDCREDKK